jgi:hypothetical protein
MSPLDIAYRAPYDSQPMPEETAASV